MSQKLRLHAALIVLFLALVYFQLDVKGEGYP